MIYAKPNKQDIKKLMLIERQRRQIEELQNKRLKEVCSEQSKTSNMSKL